MPATSRVVYLNTNLRTGRDHVTETVHSPTDEQLVMRAQKGDRRAFDLLVRKYQSRIMALIARFIQDPHEVMDVAQEAFIKAYRALPGFRGDSGFYTWLYRIAANTAKNHLAAAGRRPPGTDVDAGDAMHYSGSEGLKTHDGPEAAMRRDQLRRAIHEALAALPEELRVALTLREFDGMSYEDISNIMGCPVGTVRSRIFRAREAVDKAIAPLLSDEGQRPVPGGHSL
ncbi:RNA polymerase sigma factor RpoE [Hahella sp. SMD15-11]|uniref:RNA polymerase sigma factor RpoE n=2 Tax=Thermohahella caldifontis TaxID=3142973 RepID=A0AB39UZN7_9GAMM